MVYPTFFPSMRRDALRPPADSPAHRLARPVTRQAHSPDGADGQPVLMRRLLRTVVLLIGLSLGSAALHARAELDFGVYSARPKALVAASWQPFVDYLNTRLVGVEVRLHALDDAGLQRALAAGELDLLLTNPVHFIELRASNPLSGPLPPWSPMPAAGP